MTNKKKTTDAAFDDLMVLLPLAGKAKDVQKTFETFVDAVMAADVDEPKMKQAVIIGVVKEMLDFTFNNALRHQQDYVFFYGQAPLMATLNSPDALEHFPINTASTLKDGQAGEYKVLVEILKLFHRKMESMEKQEKQDKKENTTP